MCRQMIPVRLPIREVILACVACVAMAGCGRQEARPTAPSGATPSAPSPSTSSPATVLPTVPPKGPGIPVADGSLDNDEYIALGVPASDRTWAGNDMNKAADVLTALHAEHPEQLPRFESTRSGPLFARIISPDNLGFFRDKTLPLESRFPDALTFMQSQSTILKIYLAAFQKKHCSGNELIELMGAQLRICHVLLDLVDEFLPTLSRDDPTYPVRMKGLETMKSGLAVVVMGSITTLTEDHAYTLEMRLKMLEYCRQEFPTIVPKLGSGSQADVQVRLREITADPKLQPMHDQLQLLSEATAKAVKDAPSE